MSMVFLSDEAGNHNRLKDTHSNIDGCPRCGMGLEWLHTEEVPYPGEFWCRECELAWKHEVVDGIHTITSRKVARPPGKRTYEIRITSASIYVDATCNEEARKIALKRLEKVGIKFPVAVDYCGNHAKWNGGIC